MYPNTPEELLEALTAQKENLPIYKNAVGATAADQTEIEQDLANLTTALNNTTIAETDKQVVTQIKNAVYDGDPKDAVAPYPAFAIAALPFPEAAAGCFTRFRERKARFKAAKGYTPEIGIALGLEKPKSGSISPDDLMPALAVRDLGGYQYEASFKKQGQDAMLIQYRPKGAEKWLEAKTALTSPVVVDAPEPASEGASVQIEIRCRLLKGNTQVGQWSPIYTLSVNA